MKSASESKPCFGVEIIKHPKAAGERSQRCCRRFIRLTVVNVKFFLDSEQTADMNKHQTVGFQCFDGEAAVDLTFIRLRLGEDFLQQFHTLSGCCRRRCFV
ncbi:uncharacterized protein V6R79_025686 [Siganus canaliculatus]